ncbi:hypothetical protein DFH06DRAFT_1484353 [Mycena polygramma]|nr:hypothetical protein DFH06DRAFT_1484353 [Mycena polygramma]
MSDNDCCGMFISCCLCCSLCNHSSDGFCVPWFINLFPARWCSKLQGKDMGEAERDQEADLFFHGQTTSQPGSIPAMSETAGGGGIRDKSQIIQRPESVVDNETPPDASMKQPDSVPP